MDVPDAVIIRLGGTAPLAPTDVGKAAMLAPLNLKMLVIGRGMLHFDFEVCPDALYIVLYDSVARRAAPAAAPRRRRSTECRAAVAAALLPDVCLVKGGDPLLRRVPRSKSPSSAHLQQRLVVIVRR